MNFTQISTFRAVMTSESLSDAATKLGRTQPAVSAAIKALEDQLGMQLFERRGRKLIPVPEAQYLLAEADSILSQMTRVRQTMRSLSAGQAGRLTVAVMPGPMTMVFPRFIASQLGDTTDITISFQARTSRQIAELARAQSVDFGFADAPEDPGDDLLYHAEVISADCLIAVPEDHRLASHDSIDIADLDKEPFGTLAMSHAQSRAVQAAFAAQGATLNQTVESQTFLPVLHFVAAGRCCTVLDPLSVFLVQGPEKMIHGVRIKPMRHPIRYDYALYSPKHRPISIVAQTLREACRTEVLRLLSEVGARPHVSRP